MQNHKLIIILFIFLLACTPQEQSQEPSQTQKGVTMTPTTDFTEFFNNAQQTGTIISWAGDWNELSKEDSAPHVLATLSKTKKYTPIIEVQFFTQSTGQLLRTLTEETKQQYKKDAVAFVEKYKPEYFAVGIEVNILFEKSPDEFTAFVEFYDDVYLAIKEVSPTTKVFTIFQLEYMKENKEWFLLDQFTSDIAAFTTYPFILYNNISAIPSDYYQETYQEITLHTTKPIVFTEIGWSDADPAFISLFFSQTKNIHPEFVIWSFLYDQNVQTPFNTMGLLDKEGTPKKGFDTWKNAQFT